MEKEPPLLYRAFYHSRELQPESRLVSEKCTQLKRKIMLIRERKGEGVREGPCCGKKYVFEVDKLCIHVAVGDL